MERENKAFGTVQVICHNDLLPGNILSPLDGENKEVLFIDFEYAGIGPRGADMANHFCEWAGLDCDLSLMPNREEALRFIRKYLDCVIDVDLPRRAISESVLLEEVAEFIPTSFLLWTMWGYALYEFPSLSSSSTVTRDFYLQFGQKKEKAFFSTLNLERINRFSI